MGVRAGIHELSAEEFEQIYVGKTNPNIKDANFWSVDKAWYDYFLIFRNAEVPLKYTLSGDCLHPESPHTLEEFYEGNHDYYAGLVSPHLVKQISELLTEISQETLKQMYSEHEVQSFGDYEWSMFTELKAAYAEAASRANALLIMIA